MDIATLIGIVLGIVLVVFGIAQGDGGIALIGNFLDFPSVLITFGGAFSSVLTSYKLKEYISGLKSITVAFKDKKQDQGETIRKIIELSNVARKEGLLALEEVAGTLEDDFMKKGILLIVDGTEPELVRGILETELSCIEDRHAKNVGFWDNLAAMGPAWGMIGTLIGLVNMLKNLDDASSIGPNMSVALLTTLYGSMLANWICTPIATKLRSISAQKTQTKEVMIEGLLSIQAGENPRVIEEKLKSFLSPTDRMSMSAQDGATE